MDNGKEPKRTPTIASFFRSVPVEEKEKSPGVQCKAVPAGKPKHKGKWSLAWKTSKKVSDSDSDFEENGDRTFAVDPAKLSNTVNVNKREQKARDKTWPDKVCVEEELSLDRPTERLTGEQSVGAQTIKEPDKGTHAYLQESTVGSSSPGDSSMGSCEPKSNVFDILMRRKPLTPIESSASDLPSDELREGEGDCPSEVLNDSVVLMNDMPPSQEKAGHAADTSTQPNMFDVLMKRHKLGGTTAESKTVSSLVNDLEPDILCTLHEKPGKPRRKKSPKFKLCIRAKGHDVQKTEDINLIESAEAPETQESGRNKGKKKRRVYKEESPVQVPVSEGVNEIPDEKFGLEKTRDCKTTEESEKTDEATEESEKADEAKGVQGTNVTAGKMKVRAENKKDGRSQKTSLSQSPDSLDFETGVRRTRLRPRREVVIGKEKEESKELDSEIEGQKSRKKKPKGRKFQGSGASKEDWYVPYRKCRIDLSWSVFVVVITCILQNNSQLNSLTDELRGRCMAMEGPPNAVLTHRGSISMATLWPPNTMAPVILENQWKQQGTYLPGGERMGGKSGLQACDWSVIIWWWQLAGPVSTWVTN